MKSIIPIEANYTNGNQLHEPTLQVITAIKRKDDDKAPKLEKAIFLKRLYLFIKNQKQTVIIGIAFIAED
jgi:hypothetical protein